MLLPNNVIWVVAKITPFVKEFLFQNDGVKTTIQHNKPFLYMMALNVVLLVSLLFITTESTRLVAQNLKVNEQNKVLAEKLNKIREDDELVKLNQPILPASFVAPTKNVISSPAPTAPTETDEIDTLKSQLRSKQ